MAKKFSLKIPKINPNKILPSKDVFGFKHRWIPNVNNNLVYVIGGITIAGLYYGAQRGYLPYSFPFGGVADSIQLSATPLARPGDQITISGQFTDSHGNSVSVPQSWIQVTEDIGTVKLNESLGVNVNRFSKTIDTTGYRGGDYTVTVSDRPITAPVTPTSSPPPAAINSPSGDQFGLVIA